MYPIAISAAWLVAGVCAISLARDAAAAKAEALRRLPLRASDCLRAMLHPPRR